MSVSEAKNQLNLNALEGDAPFFPQKYTNLCNLSMELRVVLAFLVLVHFDVRYPFIFPELPLQLVSNVLLSSLRFNTSSLRKLSLVEGVAETSTQFC